MVITIDFAPKLDYDPSPHGIQSIVGVSTTTTTFAKVAKLLSHRTEHLGRPARVMVVLDSDHSRGNVANELALYGPLVTPGQYLVVEDTNVNGHPVMPDHGPGPYEAVQEFLYDHRDFHADLERERLLFTQNPGGWLKRTSE